jgi:hypothetical protein
MYRSGSTRLFNLLREVASRNFENYVSGHPGEEGELIRWVNEYPNWVAKEHQISPAIHSAINNGDIRTFGTIREPIDCLISAHTTFGWGTETCAELVNQSLDTILSVKEQAILLSYEDNLALNAFGLQQFVKIADLHCGAHTAQWLILRYRRSRVQRLSKKTPALGHWDPVTLIHPNHVATRPKPSIEVLNQFREAVEVRRMNSKYLELSAKAWKNR